TPGKGAVLPPLHAISEPPPPTSPNTCLLPFSYGACAASVFRWYYSQESRRCGIFIFSGCGGNSNNYDSKQTCEAACATSGSGGAGSGGETQSDGFHQGCEDAPCRNGATCVSAGTSGPFTCICRAGYAGLRCTQYIGGNRGNICDTNPCQNGGRCLSSSPVHYTCACQRGYRGATCQIIRVGPDPCRYFVCLNGGRCYTTDGATPRCSCATGFGGSTCNANMDPCRSNPCQNRATCIKEWGHKFYCVCPWGYVGRLCQIRRPGVGIGCDPNPCLNNARCSENGDDFRCSCRSGWTGKLCDDPDICASSPCKNGGTCVPHSWGTRFRCDCSEHTATYYCESR
ncbi:PREDICTED: adhesive plaque matrix protein 2-like, partial [Priapulus caudatus]|uniref:Adhesive plaque matrix protein 2-like n=1 Tax=Priapulus caudatus TaxID=37621 RepID=A0ABM1EVU1_PRICU